jgi:predicted metallopeptidase
MNSVLLARLKPRLLSKSAIYLDFLLALVRNNENNSKNPLGRFPVTAAVRQFRSLPPLPLELRWHAQRPLPRLLLRSSHVPGPWQEAPPWLLTGPVEQPFDFGGHVHRLLADIVARCPSLGHIDVASILLGATRARNQRTQGLQARVTPLRFAHGSLTRRRHGATYQVQRYFFNDHEFLYLMTFCLPRFLNQDFADKFITLFHELHHIHPSCNGDLRRHEGRYQLHSHSKCAYDRHMAELARAYLAGKPNPDLHAFLRLDFAQLQRRHGAVAAIVLPRPKIIPIAWKPHVQLTSPKAAACFPGKEK